MPHRVFAMLYCHVLAAKLTRACAVPAFLGYAYSGYWTCGQRQSLLCGADPWVWKTRTMNIPVSYTNWVTGQPNCQNQNEMCLHLTTPTYLGIGTQWADINCAWLLCPMCEMSLWQSNRHDRGNNKQLKMHWLTHITLAHLERHVCGTLYST